jgi:uncharacterized OB-fold protein
VSDEELTSEALSDEEYETARDNETGKLKPSDPNKTYCSTCQHIMRPYYARCPKCEGDRNRIKIDRLAEVIRELKTSVTRDLEPDRERELIKLLEVYQHPDAKGFLGWLSNAREQARSAPQKGRRR